MNENIQCDVYQMLATSYTDTETTHEIGVDDLSSAECMPPR